MTNREIFSKNLSELIFQHGGNQKDLATCLNVSKQTVSAWINGKAYPRADVMEKIANYFGTTIPALVYDRREQMEEAEIVYFFHALPDEGKAKLLERTEELAILYGLLKKGETIRDRS